MRIAIIDGDSIAYLCSKDTVEQSLVNVDGIMDSIMKETGSTHYYLFLSEGPYFRHTVNPEYKAKRTVTSLKYTKTLRSYMIEQYGAALYHNVEADDMIAFCQNECIRDKISSVICAIDKDVIEQVPGTSFNYRTHITTTTNTEEALVFLCTQSLMGDSTDNIKGIPKVGAAKAKAMLEGLDLQDLLPTILKQYQKHYVSLSESVFEFQKNFRQVYLLRSPADFTREVGYIPELPILRSYEE